jgi:EAL domain-containing protein (putative c-di-GMP-specific phosphodiesterase class I)
LSQLKIDKSFVLDMEQDENDAVIVRSMIDLAHNLGLRVVAEGVENQDVSNLLTMLGCDLLQGYHFARPMPAADFEQWLNRRMV